MRGEQLIIVLYMHKPWVYLVNHCLSEVLLQHSLVFLSQSDHRAIYSLHRSHPYELCYPAVLFVSWVDLESIPNNKKYIRQVQFQGFCYPICQTHQYLLEPLMTLPTRLFILLNLLILLPYDRLLLFTDKTRTWSL